MPVVQRPRKESGPSGLEKFLSTINVVAGIGGRVADVIQTNKQQDLTERGLKIQEEYVGLQRQSAEDSDFSRVLAMGINAAEAGRMANLATMASQGRPVDPNITLAATVVGDIADPTLRETTRAAIAGLLGRDPSEIGDLFIMSPDTLASESSRDITAALEDVRNFRRLTAQGALGPGGDVAARRGETAQLSLVPGAQVGGLTREEALQNEANELMRVAYNEQTGQYELDGAAINNAGPTLDIVLGLLGEPGLPKEFDPRPFGLSGPKRIVSGPVFDELTKNALNALWSSDENARATVRDSAQLLVEKFQVPFSDALALVEGRYGDVTPGLGNDRFYEMMRSWNRGMAELVGSMSPQARSLINLMQTLSEANVPSDQIIDAASAFQKAIVASGGRALVPENLGAVQNFLNGLLGGPTGMTLDFRDGTRGVLTPQAGGGVNPRGGIVPGQPVPAANQPPPDPQQTAIQNAFNAFAQTILSLPESQRADSAQAQVGLHSFTDPATGEVGYLVITQDMINQILGTQR